MTGAGIVLYGPPASGKSSTAFELGKLGAHLYRPIKCGRGRTEGYRMVDTAELERIRHDGDVLWERRRYGAVYLWLRPELQDLASVGCVVIELGQPEAVTAVTSGLPAVTWMVVELACPRPVAAARIAARSTGDDAERMSVWDATPSLAKADRHVDTSAVSAAEVAADIWSHVSNDTPERQVTDTGERTREAP